MLHTEYTELFKFSFSQKASILFFFFVHYFDNGSNKLAPIHWNSVTNQLKDHPLQVYQADAG